MKDAERRVARLMRTQFGLVTRSQALQCGLTARQVDQRLVNTDWIRLHRSVFGASTAPPTAERALLAATLAAGPESAASHLSAAWLLGITDRPPAHPVVTVPYQKSPALSDVVVHRSRDLDLSRVLVRRGIPYTDPLRILTDVAGELSADQLCPLVDRALATKLVTTKGLEEEIARRARPGRRGPARLKKVLGSRGMIGGPEPSVLEAMALRLFQRWNIPVLGREQHIYADGRYRIDFIVGPRLIVEVDGFAYHWTPEAKAYDDRRRNRLRAVGMTVLVYDWRSVKFEAGRLAKEVRQAQTTVISHATVASHAS
jgi:hypothetical protein